MIRRSCRLPRECRGRCRRRSRRVGAVPPCRRRRIPEGDFGRAAPPHQSDVSLPAPTVVPPYATGRPQPRSTLGHPATQGATPAQSVSAQSLARSPSLSQPSEHESRWRARGRGRRSRSPPVAIDEDGDVLARGQGDDDTRCTGQAEVVVAGELRPGAGAVAYVEHRVEEGALGADRVGATRWRRPAVSHLARAAVLAGAVRVVVTGRHVRHDERQRVAQVHLRTVQGATGREVVRAVHVVTVGRAVQVVVDAVVTGEDLGGWNHRQRVVPCAPDAPSTKMV